MAVATFWVGNQSAFAVDYAGTVFPRKALIRLVDEDTTSALTAFITAQVSARNFVKIVDANGVPVTAEGVPIDQAPWITTEQLRTDMQGLFTKYQALLADYAALYAAVVVDGGVPVTGYIDPVDANLPYWPVAEDA